MTLLYYLERFMKTFWH